MLGVGHSDVLEISILRTKGIKSLLEFQLDLPRLPSGQDSAHLPELLGRAWFTAVRTLTTQNGPLGQFNVALLQLQRKITSGSGLYKV